MFAIVLLRFHILLFLLILPPNLSSANRYNNFDYVIKGTKLETVIVVLFSLFFSRHIYNADNEQLLELAQLSISNYAKMLQTFVNYQKMSKQSGRKSTNSQVG